MQKTLYATDLDGTLLQNDITVSPYTAEVINAFIEKGGLFTYASARSSVSASRATAPLRLNLSVIHYNGTFIDKPKTGETLWTCTIAPQVAEGILEKFLSAGIHPIVYSFIDGMERVSWVEGHGSEGILRYIAGRPGDVRNRPVQEADRLLDGDVFYMLMIDTRAETERMHRQLPDASNINIHTLEDSYNPGDFWFEISPKDAGKDKALLRLKEMVGAERLVCFGDNLNDIPMFLAADEAYAMANAQPELKAISTGVISSNTDDGVARFLRERERL